MRLAFAPYRLIFREPGGTSRGVMTEKPTFLIKVYDESAPAVFGIGEAAVFPGLSPEADGNYVNRLLNLMANVALGLSTDLSESSSIQFGLEQALLDYSNGCQGVYFPSAFTFGQKEIEINGLIWMGSYDVMLKRVEKKLKEGFRCLKLKIGAIDWEDEIKLIEGIRRRYSSKELILRVDANAAFSTKDALHKLEILAKYDIHSIEQPIKAGNPEEMAILCKNSPLPIALDEELIGVNSKDEKIRLLDFINPQFIIIKPALCGGFSGGEEWIGLAKERNIGWWITSALESNIGLNAIAQWTAYINAEGPQGLGTGGVFTNNFITPVFLKNDNICYDINTRCDKSQFDNLIWHT